MKKTFTILLAVFSAAAIMATISACAELRGNTTLFETTDSGIKKSIVAESGKTSNETTVESTYAGTTSSAEPSGETIAPETTSKAPETSVPEAPSIDLPETTIPETESPETTSQETNVPEVPTTEAITETAAPPEVSQIDVDLTTLSSTMVYAEVFNMMMNPGDYIGKTVKMRGAFGIGYSYKEDGTMDENTLVYACVIADATACCSQGIEFILSVEHTYPDDYPELGSEITVVGTFATYEEYSMLFCTLTDAVMEK